MGHFPIPSNLFKLMPTISCLLDSSNHKILEMNDCFENTLNCDRSHSLNKPFTDLCASKNDVENFNYTLTNGNPYAGLTNTPQLAVSLHHVAKKDKVQIRWMVTNLTENILLLTGWILFFCFCCIV